MADTFHHQQFSISFLPDAGKTIKAAPFQTTTLQAAIQVIARTWMCLDYEIFEAATVLRSAY